MAKTFLDTLQIPAVMGVLNVTPDSFSDGGRVHQGAAIDSSLLLAKAVSMVEAGASFLDVGGESTRPGAVAVSVQEELDRVIPAIEIIKKETGILVSVDTSTPQVMAEAASAGADMINDVRALSREGALEVAAATGLPVCLMHMLGEPDTMQSNPEYYDVFAQVSEYLKSRVELCVEAGIERGSILLDPGFGFGKTLAHNLELLDRLDEFKSMGLPLLVGMSRKSMIGQVLGKPVEQRLYGSLAVATIAVMKGAGIIRVHDVVETVDAVKMAAAVMSARIDR